MPRTKKKQTESQPTLIEAESTGQELTRFEREADRIIDSEIKVRKRKYRWANDGEAFAHLFVHYRFDLDEEEAAQDCQVGRAGHDRGIDAYRLEEDHVGGTGTFYIVQTKSNRVTHDEEVLYVDARRAIDFLVEDNAEGAKSTLGEVLEIYREAVKKKYEVIFVLGLNGRADKVRAALADFESVLPIQCQIEVFDLDDIRALVMRPKHIPPDGPTVVFHNLPARPWELQLLGTPKTISCAVHARDLGRYVRTHRLAIFSLNVREYLGSKNPVNRIVAESLKRNPEKFHYLNLGIDAVCEAIRIDELIDLDNKPEWTLTVPNFQIVNGCQTAKTISELEVDPNALVMVRLIEVEKDERVKLVPEISVAKNRQSPIHGRDLFAWDLSQQRLKREFEKLGYFFETREKEWDAFSKQQANAHSLFPHGRLDNTQAARAFLAVYLQDPFRAKHRKKDFFQHEQDGGVFEKIFSETAAEHMLMAHNLYQFVTYKCKQAGKVFRSLAAEAEKRELTQGDDYKLEEANVIWNGDTYLASLMGFFLGRYYDLALGEDESLRSCRKITYPIRSMLMSGELAQGSEERASPMD